ncbi:MAG: hypothetical protein AAF664_12750 [Planctomycetota bacterium]
MEPPIEPGGSIADSVDWESLGASLKFEGDRLTQLDLRKAVVDESMLQAAGQLGDLKVLRLSPQSVEELGLEDVVSKLHQLTNLKVLALDGAPVKDDSLATWISSLPSLKELYLAKTNAGDLTATAIAQCPVVKLRLAETKLTNSGFATLASLSDLQELDISGNPLLDEGIAAGLSRLSSLKKLNLYDTSVGDQAAISISESMSGIRWLNLDKTKISDAAVVSLTNLDQLDFLHLGSTSISDEAFEPLSKLKSLTRLIVTRTEMSKPVSAQLADALPDTKVEWEYQP